jgi:hypothetical protein
VPAAIDAGRAEVTSAGFGRRAAGSVTTGSDGTLGQVTSGIGSVLFLAAGVLACERLARLDRATSAYRADSRRPWALYAWAVLWVLLTSASYWDGAATTAYARLALATATFVAWSWVVLRLTDAGERLDATTTERRLAGPPATTSA